MITAIQIEQLRGIRSATIDGLSPLSVLVGPNGCGKSTVLDALLLASTGSPGDAVGRVIQRRVELKGGARWLFWRGGRTNDPTARIHVHMTDTPPRELTLRLLSDVSTAHEADLQKRGGRPPYVEIESSLIRQDAQLVALTAVAYEGTQGNQYVFRQDGHRDLKAGTSVRLVDPRPGGTHAPLWKSFSEVGEEGRLADVEALLAEVIVGFKRLLLLSDDAGVSIVHIEFADHTVPVAVSGDGIQTLVQVSLAVAQRRGSTVLLEEPEATQHPKSVYESARAIVAAVKRGVQVILSTHSLDLIDMLREHLGDELSKLSVHHLACLEGDMSIVRYSGVDVAIARDTIGEDLR